MGLPQVPAPRRVNDFDRIYWAYWTREVVGQEHNEWKWALRVYQRLGRINESWLVPSRPTAIATHVSNTRWGCNGVR